MNIQIFKRYIMPLFAFLIMLSVARAEENKYLWHNQYVSSIKYILEENEHIDYIDAKFFDNDQSIVLVRVDSILLYDAKTGLKNNMGTITGFKTPIIRANVQKEKSILATQHNDTTIMIWNLKSGKLINTLTVPLGEGSGFCPANGCRGFQIDVSGEKLFTWGYESRIFWGGHCIDSSRLHTYDIKSGKIENTVYFKDVVNINVLISPDNKYYIHPWGKLIDLKTSNIVINHILGYGLCFSLNNQFLGSVKDHELNYWDLNNQMQFNKVKLDSNFGHFIFDNKNDLYCFSVSEESANVYNPHLYKYTLQGEYKGMFKFQRNSSDKNFRFWAYFSDISKSSDKMLFYREFSYFEDQTESKESEMFLVGTDQISKVEDSPNSDFCNIQVSPNPTSDKIVFNINLENIREINAQITDMSGKNIKTFFSGIPESMQLRYDFDCSNLPSGTYLFSIKSSKGIQSIKFNVEK